MDEKPTRGRPKKQDTQLSKETLRKRSQRRRKAEAKKSGKPIEVKKGGRPKKIITGTNQKPIKVQIEVTGSARSSSRGGRSKPRGSIRPKVPPQVVQPAPIIVQPAAPDPSTSLALVSMHREQQNTIAQTLQMQQNQITRGQEQFQQLSGSTREAMLQMGDSTKSRFDRLESQMGEIPERTMKMAQPFMVPSRGSRQDNLQQPFSEAPLFRPSFHTQPDKPEPLSLEEVSRQSSASELNRTTSGLVNNDFNRTRQVGSEFNQLPDAPTRERSADVPSAFRNVRSNVQPILRASSDPIEDRRAEQDSVAIGKSLNRDQEKVDMGDVKQYLRLQKATKEAEETSKEIEKLLSQTQQVKPDMPVVGARGPLPRKSILKKDISGSDDDGPSPQEVARQEKRAELKKKGLENIESKKQLRLQQWAKEGKLVPFDQYSDAVGLFEMRSNELDQDIRRRKQTPEEIEKRKKLLKKNLARDTNPYKLFDIDVEELNLKKQSMSEEKYASELKDIQSFFEAGLKSRNLPLAPLKQSEPIREAPPVAQSKQRQTLDEPIIREATKAEQETKVEPEPESESEDEPDLVFRGTDTSKPFIGKLEKHLEDMIEASPVSKKQLRTNTLKIFNEKVKGKIPVTYFAVKFDKDLLESSGLSETEFRNVQLSIKKNSELKNMVIKAFKKDNAGRDEDELSKLLAF